MYPENSEARRYRHAEWGGYLIYDGAHHTGYPGQKRAQHRAFLSVPLWVKPKA